MIYIHKIKYVRKYNRFRFDLKLINLDNKLVVIHSIHGELNKI